MSPLARVRKCSEFRTVTKQTPPRESLPFLCAWIPMSTPHALYLMPVTCLEQDLCTPGVADAVLGPHAQHEVLTPQPCTKLPTTWLEGHRLCPTLFCLGPLQVCAFLRGLLPALQS